MTGFKKENGIYKIAPVSDDVLCNFEISKLYFRYLPLFVIFGKEEAKKMIDADLAKNGENFITIRKSK